MSQGVKCFNFPKLYTTHMALFTMIKVNCLDNIFDASFLKQLLLHLSFSSSLKGKCISNMWHVYYSGYFCFLLRWYCNIKRIFRHFIFPSENINGIVLDNNFYDKVIFHCLFSGLLVSNYSFLLNIWC